MANMLDTYTQGLAALKKRYSSADQAGQMDIQKEGLQYRQKALADGVDLNQLEDSTNKFMNPNYNATAAGADPYEQNYRADLFKQVSSTPRVGTLPTTTPATNTGPTNQFYDKTTTQLSNIEQALKTPYVYDPNNDPLVAGAKANADKRSKQATNSMMEDMNSRGILNSTVTSDRATDIRLQNEDQVTAMLPQFAQMGYSNHQQELNNQFGLANSYKAMGDTQMSNTFQESDRTGIYKNPALESLYGKTIEAKKIAENPNATSEQKKAAAMAADEFRRQIAQLGGNPDLVGYENDANQASEAVGKYGSLTMQAQTAKLNTIMGIGNNYSSLPTGTGNLVGSLPQYKDLQGFVTGLEGKPTLQGGQLDVSRQNANRLSAGTDKSPSYTEMMKRSTTDAVNYIVGRSRNKKDAKAQVLSDPDMQKVIKEEGLSIADINAEIDRIYGADPKETPRPGALTDKDVWDYVKQDIKDDLEYDDATPERQAAIEDKYLQKWLKAQKGN